jgi:ribosomal protein S18 acetylase RimI-like enzyme
MDVSRGEDRPIARSSQPATEPVPFASGELLTRAHTSFVDTFTCARPGMTATLFEQDVSDWLKDRRAGAFEAVRLRLSEVRLFFCPHSHALMGYGAIGMEKWRFPDDVEVPLWVLQYAGVHTQFRHQQNIASEARFGKRLLRGMLEEVRARGTCKQVGLFVDPENPMKDWYRDNFLFQELDIEQDGDRTWVRMVRAILI